MPEEETGEDPETETERDHAAATEADAVKEVSGDTYARVGQPFYLCQFCRRKTYHPKDIENHYCPCCGSEDLPKNCGHMVGRSFVEDLDVDSDVGSYEV